MGVDGQFFCVVFRVFQRTVFGNHVSDMHGDQNFQRLLFSLCKILKEVKFGQVVKMVQSCVGEVGDGFSTRVITVIFFTCGG